MPKMSGKRGRRALEKLGLVERTIVHFDIRGNDSRKRWDLHRFLHGRVDRKRLSTEVKTYRYAGLLHEGGVRVGQSVYLLPPDLASRLIVKLRDLGVRHEWRDVFVSG